MDHNFIHKFQPVTDEEKLDFRRRYTVSEFPQRRVVFIVHQAEHWFTVVLDYLASTAWVLGSSIQKEGQSYQDVPWECWRGPLIWKNISALFGWGNVSEDANQVIGIDWNQV